MPKANQVIATLLFLMLQQIKQNVMRNLEGVLGFKLLTSGLSHGYLLLNCSENLAGGH
jgi:hypothetical protein